jgi:hypothetical protein
VPQPGRATSSSLTTRAAKETLRLAPEDLPDIEPIISQAHGNDDCRYCVGAFLGRTRVVPK